MNNMDTLLSGQGSRSKTEAEVIRALRIKMLKTRPSEIGCHPNREYPRIFGVLMDWPFEGHITTVLSMCSGEASIYNSATFGIIVGSGCESVRSMARLFVKAANDYYVYSTPTNSHAYPRSGHVLFYLLTYAGIRSIDADLDMIERGISRFTPLFSFGASVVELLHRKTRKKQ